MPHGTFCFTSFDGYGWYLSSTAALLYVSWVVHNMVAWLKIRPFLTKRASSIFIGTLCLSVPPIILQIVNNFLFFNNIKDLYVKVRPFEVLMRLVDIACFPSDVLISFQRSMVDLCLRFVFLSHEDWLQVINTRAHQWPSSLRHNAPSNALLHPVHNCRRVLEHYTRLDHNRRVSPPRTIPTR
jgi:hypothetical protein